MKHLPAKQIFRIILVILLVIGVGLSFLRFLDENSKRISSQNEEYLNEFTKQRAVSINSLMAENLSFIQTTAFLYGESLTSPFANVSTIAKYEKSASFDMLRFIDKSGDNYTSQGVMSNLADRAYFRSGMKGESGVTYVAQSRVTGQKQIGFYTPVYYQDEIIGVMIGFYGEDYVTKLLEYELFGFEGEGWLCMPDGTVMGSTFEENPDNYLSWLEEKNLSAEERTRITEAFVKGEECAFTYEEEGGTAVAYSVGLDYNGWILIRTFPAAASSRILANADREGSSLLISLIILFAVFAALNIVIIVLDFRKTREANRKANDISTGVSNLFDKFAVLDLRNDLLEYLNAMPDEETLPESGEYTPYVEALLARIPDEQQKQEVKEYITTASLKTALADSDFASIRVHAPLRQRDIWYTYNFVVIERIHGEPARLLVVRQDSTVLYQKEEEARRKLEEALNAAEKANHAKTEFLFNMSHDIRTPMNAIMGFTDIADSHIEDTAFVKEAIGKIRVSSKHLLSLINDVLDMSRIESGKMTLNEEEFSLAEMVNGLTDIIRPQAEEKNQTLFVETGLEHPWIHGDSLHLSQILLNIISNAVKYTPENGTIAIRIKEYPDGKDQKSIYEFVVKDNGIGMSEEYLPHLFESFTREQNTTISKIQGTGLGMAIAKKLVDLMGGEIAVASKPGQGTEFTVRIPAVYEEQEKQQAEECMDAGQTVDLSEYNLLLVEDNPINAEIATFILTEAGYGLDYAENGRIAVEMTDRQHDKYSAILMDVQMPEMNGYEATAAIRAMEEERGWRRVPIIAMTANTFEDDRRNAFEAGMDAHIAKPYQADDMLKTVTEYATKTEIL